MKNVWKTFYNKSWFLSLLESTHFTFRFSSTSHSSLTASAEPLLKTQQWGDFISIEINCVDDLKRFDLKLWGDQAGSGAVFTMCGNPNNFNLKMVPCNYSFWFAHQGRYFEFWRKPWWFWKKRDFTPVLGSHRKVSFGLSRAFNDW